MSYAIELVSPQGERFFIPKDYGFGVHQYTKNLDEAESFEDRSKALQRLNAHLYPPAFWECERRHAEAMKVKMRGWNCRVIEKESVAA